MKKTTFLVISAFFLAFFGCNTGTGGDPKVVLNNFIEAIASKNINEAKKYVTKDSEGMLGMLQMAMNSAPDAADKMPFKKENMEIGNPVIDGDRATVPVKEKISGEVTDFVLKKEGGDWKVAFDKSTLMEMGQKKMKEHNMETEGMDSSTENLNMDSIQNHLKNLSKEDKEKALKMMDSATKLMNEMQKNSK